MIKQPELGKKIADFRKSRGFTQEKLVEKCNLSVRTLQRIEAGEVTPRSSTVKLIFEALDLEFNDPLFSSIENNNRMIIEKLEQFYRYFIDLFDLRTQTMKKVTILAVLLTAIIIVVLTTTNIIYTQEETSVKNEISQYEDSSKDEDTSMRYTFFRSEESFYYENKLMIARNTVLTSNGVKISSTLILVNEATREFTTSDITGRLTKNKVEIFCSREFLNSINYSSLEEQESYNKFHLIGDAKIILGKNKFIEAPEIILTFE